MSQTPPQSWGAWLAEILMGFLQGEATKDALRGIGGTPDQLGGAMTTAVVLPTFAGPVGPPPGLDESRDVGHCHPELQRRFASFKADYEGRAGRQLFVTCTYRSMRVQHQYWLKGRRGIVGEAKITNVDGITQKGRHNVWPAEAIDVAIDMDPGPGKHLSWDRAAYAIFAELAIKHGLVWGGDWNRNGRSDDERFIDAPHLELPAEAC